MKKQCEAVDRIDKLVNTLSEIAAPFRYRVATVFDENKTQVATLCVAPLEDSEELSAEALLLKYESKNSWMTFFYDRLDSLTFPGGSPEEIELKAAVGVKAILKRSDFRLLSEDFFNGI